MACLTQKHCNRDVKGTPLGVQNVSSFLLLTFFVTLFFEITLLPFAHFAEATVLSSSQMQICTNDGSEAIPCTRKIVVSLALDSGQEATESVVYWASTVGLDGKTLNLKDAYTITVSKSRPMTRYPLVYRASFNAKPYETHIRTAAFGCRDTFTSSNPTCGFMYDTNGAAIPYSQGFCCSCSFCNIAGVCEYAKRPSLSCSLWSDAEAGVCMRMAQLFYGAYALQPPETWYEITVTIRKGSGGGAEEAVLRLGPDVLGQKSERFGVSARLVGDFAKFKEAPTFDSKLMLVPSTPLSHERVRAQIPNEWMFVEKSMITMDGSECDKVGVSYYAFNSLGERCKMEKGSCLKNQIEDLRTADMEKEKLGLAGQYMLRNFGSFVYMRSDGTLITTMGKRKGTFKGLSSGSSFLPSPSTARVAEMGGNDSSFMHTRTNRAVSDESAKERGEGTTVRRASHVLQFGDPNSGFPGFGPDYDPSLPFAPHDILNRMLYTNDDATKKNHHKKATSVVKDNETSQHDAAVLGVEVNKTLLVEDNLALNNNTSVLLGLADSSSAAATSSTTSTSSSPYLAFLQTGVQASLVTLQFVADGMAFVVNVAPAKLVAYNVTSFEANSKNGKLVVSIMNIGNITADFQLSVTGCSSGTFPIAAAVESIPAKTTRTLTLDVFSAAVSGGVTTCTMKLYNALYEVTDEATITWTTFAEVPSSPQDGSGGNNGNGGDKGNGSGSRSGEDSCYDCPWYNPLCFVTRDCFAALVAQILTVVGFIVLALLVIRFRRPIFRLMKCILQFAVTSIKGGEASSGDDEDNNATTTKKKRNKSENDDDEDCCPRETAKSGISIKDRLLSLIMSSSRFAPQIKLTDAAATSSSPPPLLIMPSSCPTSAPRQRDRKKKTPSLCGQTMDGTLRICSTAGTHLKAAAGSNSTFSTMRGKGASSSAHRKVSEGKESRKGITQASSSSFENNKKKKDNRTAKHPPQRSDSYAASSSSSSLNQNTRHHHNPDYHRHSQSQQGNTATNTNTTRTSRSTAASTHRNSSNTTTTSNGLHMFMKSGCPSPSHQRHQQRESIRRSSSDFDSSSSSDGASYMHRGGGHRGDDDDDRHGSNVGGDDYFSDDDPHNGPVPTRSRVMHAKLLGYRVPWGTKQANGKEGRPMSHKEVRGPKSSRRPSHAHEPFSEYHSQEGDEDEEDEEAIYDDDDDNNNNNNNNYTASRSVHHHLQFPTPPPSPQARVYPAYDDVYQHDPPHVARFLMHQKILRAKAKAIIIQKQRGTDRAAQGGEREEEEEEERHHYQLTPPCRVSSRDDEESVEAVDHQRGALVVYDKKRGCLVYDRMKGRRVDRSSSSVNRSSIAANSLIGWWGGANNDDHKLHGKRHDALVVVSPRASGRRRVTQEDTRDENEHSHRDDGYGVGLASRRRQGIQPTAIAASDVRLALSWRSSSPPREEEETSTISSRNHDRHTKAAKQQGGTIRRTRGDGRPKVATRNNRPEHKSTKDATTNGVFSLTIPPLSFSVQRGQEKEEGKSPRHLEAVRSKIHTRGNTYYTDTDESEKDSESECEHHDLSSDTADSLDDSSYATADARVTINHRNTKANETSRTAAANHRAEWEDLVATPRQTQVQRMNFEYTDDDGQEEKEEEEENHSGMDDDDYDVHKYNDVADDSQTSTNRISRREGPTEVFFEDEQTDNEVAETDSDYDQMIIASPRPRTKAHHSSNGRKSPRGVASRFPMRTQKQFRG